MPRLLFAFIRTVTCSGPGIPGPVRRTGQKHADGEGDLLVRELRRGPTFSGAVTLALVLVISAPATAQDLSEIDSIFAEFDSSATPGCAVAASHEGRVLFGRGYGKAHLDHGVPITPATASGVFASIRFRPARGTGER